jgi:type II secretory pathway component GspD/PulD (secretin)
MPGGGGFTGGGAGFPGGGAMMAGGNPFGGGGRGGWLGGFGGGTIEAKVFKLENSSAADTASALSKLFSGKVLGVYAEPVTNTVIVAAEPAILKDITKVIQEIDRAMPAPKTGTGPGKGTRPPAGGGPMGGPGGGDAGGGSPWGGAPSGGGPNQFQVFTLKHVAADDVIAALQQAFPTANLRAVAEKASNSLVILSVDANVMKDIAKVIEQLDTKPGPKPDTGPGMGMRPPGSGMPMGGPPGGTSMGGPPGGMLGGASTPSSTKQTTVIALKYASAEELAAVLSRVFTSPPAATQKVQITADARSNQIVIRSDSETAIEVAKLVEKLDVPVQKR